MTRPLDLATTGITHAVRIGSDAEVWANINTMLSNAPITIGFSGSGGVISPANFIYAASNLRDRKIADKGLEDLEPIIGTIMKQAEAHKGYGLRHLAYRINMFRFKTWVALYEVQLEEEYQNFIPTRISQILQTLEYAATPPNPEKETYNQKIDKLTTQEKEFLLKKVDSLISYPNLKRLVNQQ